MEKYLLEGSEWKIYNDIVLVTKGEKGINLANGRLVDLFDFGYKVQRVSNINTELSTFNIQKYILNNSEYSKYLYKYEINILREIFDGTTRDDYYKVIVNTNLDLTKDDIQKIGRDFFNEYNYNPNLLLGMNIITTDYVKYNFFDQPKHKETYTEYIFTRANEDDEYLCMSVRSNEVGFEKTL